MIPAPHASVPVINLREADELDMRKSPFERRLTTKSPSKRTKLSILASKLRRSTPARGTPGKPSGG